MTRARKRAILLNVNWEDIQNKPLNIGADQVTYENLNANGDIGTGDGQVATGDHDHKIGDQVVVFENALI